MSYGYDDAGNQISRTDGNGNTTQFQYDARKRLIKTIYPDGHYDRQHLRRPRQPGQCHRSGR